MGRFKKYLVNVSNVANDCLKSEESAEIVKASSSNSASGSCDDSITNLTEKAMEKQD